MTVIQIILENSSLIFVVLLIGALSGLVSERAGVVNIGIEGMMTMGALAFALFGKGVGGQLGNWSQILALLIAGGVGCIFALLHAFASITLRANQVISGVSLNILAAAIALFVVQLPGNNGFISFTNAYSLPKVGSGEFFNIYLLIAIMIVISLAVGLRYTQWGLRHIAVGENPSAADTAGINVNRKRYKAVLLSGFLAAIAGAVFAMYASSTFRGTVNGNGYLSLAILIFGQWRVGIVFIGAALFAIAETAGVQISSISGISDWVVTNKALFNILPFAISLFVLVFSSKWSKAPAALGQVYEKSQR